MLTISTSCGLLFRFGSWMGGDRDGNPNVTSQTTRDVCLIARLEAANAYFHVVESLMFDLSVWRCSPDFKVLLRSWFVKGVVY